MATCHSLYKKLEECACNTVDIGSVYALLTIRVLAVPLTGRIIRSACPTGASEQDVQILREKLGVKHLVRSAATLLLDGQMCRASNTPSVLQFPILHCPGNQKQVLAGVASMLDLPATGGFTV
jgi:hypothetical protein